MKILALDSSGLAASVAVMEDECLLAEFTVNYKKTHSQTLLPMLDEVRKLIELDLDSLDAIAVASGPGSFTGLRIGSATAKGLGLALAKPLVEVPTLEGLAYNLYGTDRLVCPLMDARRNQVYTGIYTFVKEGQGWRMETLEPQCAVDVSVILQRLNELGREVIFLGDGVPVFRERIGEILQVPFGFAPAGRNRQSAASVALRGMFYLAQGRTVSAAAHQPQYLRLSQAERERQAAFPLRIRRFRPEDAEAVGQLEARCLTTAWSVNSFEKLAEDPASIGLLAELDGRIVGFASVTDIQGDGEVNNVAVEPEFRGRGIAKALMTELIRQGEAMGITAFTLEVRTGNAAAIHVYESLGFVSAGIRPGFYENPKEDAMILWRR